MPHLNKTIVDNSPWYYYIRAELNKWVLGIVSKRGQPIAVGGIDIKINFNGIPEEVTDEDALLPLPRTAELDFVKGIAYEYLLTEGITMKVYDRAFEDVKEKMKRRIIRNMHRPKVITPIKIVPASR